jgi:hypothetical protein
MLARLTDWGQAQDSQRAFFENGDRFGFRQARGRYASLWLLALSLRSAQVKSDRSQILGTKTV